MFKGDIIKKDIKNFSGLVIIYLVLQYLAVYCVEGVGLLINQEIHFLLEYFYYFLMIVAIIYLTLGSLLLLLYLIIKPALIDKKINYNLTENLLLYRLFGIIIFFFIGLLNFFVALSIITDFDITIIFTQSLQFYIGLNFGIETVISLILIGYHKIYNKKLFVNKLNISLTILLIVIIYLAGNLYYYDYFKYGMIVLLSGYLLIGVNLKLICRKIGQTKLTKLVWGTLAIVLVFCIIFSTIQGENLKKQEEEIMEEKYESPIVYPSEAISTKFGEIKKYHISEESTKYVFTYQNKYYSINLTNNVIGSELYMQNLTNMEYVRLYINEDNNYLDSLIFKEKSKNQTKKESYLTCNGSYKDQELNITKCLDNDTKNVLQYFKNNL
ncbi:MAG: hypothetical protein ACK5HR_04725 [Mycoplasmatales bacterium]